MTEPRWGTAQEPVTDSTTDTVRFIVQVMRGEKAHTFGIGTSGEAFDVDPMVMLEDVFAQVVVELQEERFLPKGTDWVVDIVDEKDIREV